MPRSTRWFFGYNVAAASTVAYIATAPGQTFVLSQLNTSVREAFEISELQLNSAYTIATVLAAFPLVLVGSWTDKIGPRKMLAIIAALCGLACATMASAQGLLTVFLGFFLLRFLGQGALSLVAQHAMAMWFHRRLGSMHGLKTVLVFGIWVPFPIIAAKMVESIGWRETYVVFALLIPLSVVPMAWTLVRDRPEELGMRMDNDPVDDPIGDATEGAAEEIVPDPTAVDTESALGIGSAEPGYTAAEARRTSAFWILAGVFFLPPLIGTAFLFDMQPMLVGRGMTKEQAAGAVAAWTATMAICALPSGYLTDKFSPRALLPIAMGLIGLSGLVLWGAESVIVASAAMAVFGVGQSIGMACAPATLARYYGRAHHGAIRSSLTVIGVIGTGLGPVLFGLSVKYGGGYGLALVGFAVACLPIMVAGVFIRPPALATPGRA